MLSTLNEHKNKYFMDTKIHIGTEILKELKNQKRSVSWLADEIGHDQSYLNKLVRKAHLKPELLFSISIALKKNFFESYYYSLSAILLDRVH